MTLPRLFSVLVLLLSALALQQPAWAADSVAGMTDKERDYTLEGDIVTVWENSFLFNDGSGQVIVDIRPHTSRELDIRGRDYIQVTGHLVDTGILKPLVMQRGSSDPVLFQGVDTLPPLHLTDVMKNTIRYRVPDSNHAAAMAPRSNSGTASSQASLRNARDASPESVAPEEKDRLIGQARQEYENSLRDQGIEVPKPAQNAPPAASSPGAASPVAPSQPVN